MDNIRKCIYIPSVDAKDLYLADNCNDETRKQKGYSLITKNGNINYNRFINSLDFSLDSEKLKSVALTICQNMNIFSFHKNSKEYSDKIINVTFKYSCRTFNKVKKNTYVKEGYLLDNLA